MAVRLQHSVFAHAVALLVLQSTFATTVTTQTSVTTSTVTTFTTTDAICNVGTGSTASCLNGGTCTAGFPDLDGSSGASDVNTLEDEFYYFFLPTLEYTCACADGYYGPRCEFAQSAVTDGDVVYTLENIFLFQGISVSEWNLARAEILRLFLAYTIEVHVDDIQVTTVSEGPTRRDRSVVSRRQSGSVRVDVNVTNVTSSNDAATMRTRVNSLSASVFPGFILARFLNVSFLSATVEQTSNETLGASSGSSSDDDDRTVFIVITAVCAGILGLLLLFACAMLLLRVRANKDLEMQAKFVQSSLDHMHMQQQRRAITPGMSALGMKADRHSSTHFYPTTPVNVPRSPNDAQNGSIKTQRSYLSAGERQYSVRTITNRNIEGTNVQVFTDEPHRTMSQ